ELVDADDQEILRQATQLAIAEAGEGKLIALAEALVPEAADDSIIARDRIQSLIRPRVQSPALSARVVKAAGLVTTMMIEWIDTCFTNAEGGDAPSDDSKASLLEIAKGERANMLLNKTVELLGKEATNSPRRKVLVDVANASLQSI